MQSIGGPTLMTNQKLKGKLADKGWLVFPKCNRLTAFDGTVLHGVVPGRSCPALLAAERSGSSSSSSSSSSSAVKANSSAGSAAKAGSSGSSSSSSDSTDSSTAAAAAPRRITFMCAFWKDIQARPTANGTPGASQLFPEYSDTRYTWQQPLTRKRSNAEWSTSTSSSSSSSSSSTSTSSSSSSSSSSSGSSSSEPVTVYPHRLNSVWDVVDSSDKSAVPVRKLKGVPDYELCFQGF